MDFILMGFFAGICSGLFGIGGAIVLIPFLVIFKGFNQIIAQGTTLLMFLLSPAFLAAIQYYRSGNADLKTAFLLWIGVFFGSALGAWFINDFFSGSELVLSILKRLFSLFLLFFAIKLWMN